MAVTVLSMRGRSGSRSVYPCSVSAACAAEGTGGGGHPAASMGMFHVDGAITRGAELLRAGITARMGTVCAVTLDICYSISNMKNRREAGTEMRRVCLSRYPRRARSAMPVREGELWALLGGPMVIRKCVCDDLVLGPQSWKTRCVLPIYR